MVMKTVRFCLIVMVVLIGGGDVFSQTYREELSLGKFYELSSSPSLSYPDRWLNSFTSGTILTDELRGASWPLKDSWLAWSAVPSVTVTVDLGNTYPIEEINFGMCSRTSWGIYFPTDIVVSVSTDKQLWTKYGSNPTVPADTSDYSKKDFVVTDLKDARYVRIKFAQATDRIAFMDEIMVFGQYADSTKHIPAYGCMHGAYPIGADGSPYMNIASFESLAGKSIRMVLWYADWSASFESAIGYLYDRVLGGRQLEVGWLPDDTTAAQIAQGSHDAFLVQWFSDCAKRNQPIWLRPMNEFNGSWTFYNSTTGRLRYGGNPQEFRWAWRRMYNIAERMGATGESQIFVWSPNMPSYPGTAENHFSAYYPGNAYVDWVGASCYNNGTSASVLLTDWYATYSQRKPLMIAEGGSNDNYTQQKKAEWITALYSNLQSTYPRIKSMVWFHPQNGTDGGEKGLRIDSTPEALAAYRNAVAPDYFLNFNAQISKWQQQ